MLLCTSSLASSDPDSFFGHLAIDEREDGEPERGGVGRGTPGGARMLVLNQQDATARRLLQRLDIQAADQMIRNRPQ